VFFPPKALLLDLDGTLADSISALYTIYTEFLKKYKKKASKIEFEKLNGISLKKAILVLKEKHQIQENQRSLLKDYMSRVKNLYHSVEPSPGARNLIAVARKRKIKIAVVTSAPKIFAESWLEKVGLYKDIELVVGGNCVEFTKPDPEPYIFAAKKLGLRTSECIAVEDSDIGIKSAVASGAQSYLYVPTRISFRKPIKIHKDVVGTLRRLDELIKIIGDSQCLNGGI